MVNNYYEAGLNRRIDLCYIGTMVEGSGGRKLLRAVTAYFSFLVKLPRYRIGFLSKDAAEGRKGICKEDARFGRRLFGAGDSVEGFFRRDH